MPSHRIPLGTRLLLSLPFTPELLDGDEYEPFCPGITGTVECWVIGHAPTDPDYPDDEPEYTICPHKNRQIGRQPMWEYLTEVDSHFDGHTSPAGIPAHKWASWTLLELANHRIERRIPERLLLPFVQKD